MLTDDERIRVMHERAANIKRQKQKRKKAARGILSTAFCLMIVISVALIMPKLQLMNVGGSGSEAMSGSIFTGTNALGYIVIGLLSFILGAAVTVLCFRLRGKDERNKSEDDTDN